MSSGAFLAFNVFLFMRSAVIGGFAALVLLSCCKRQPSDESFVVPLIIFPGMVELFVLNLCFRGETTFTSSTLTIWTSSGRLLYHLFRRTLFYGLCSNAVSPRKARLEEKVCTGLKRRSTFSKRGFAYISAFVSHFIDLSVRSFSKGRTLFMNRYIILWQNILFC